MARDYTLIIDKSGSMGASLGKTTRWNAIKESTLAFASKMLEKDEDGITIYTFANSHKRYDNVNSTAAIEKIFIENEPNGGTNLAGVLGHALDDYFARKADGKTKDGDTILVVTDGEPNDQKAVEKVIVDASNKLDRDEEIGIQFIQIGDDEGASKFLSYLDDNLTCKFDIVDTIPMSKAEDMTITEILLRAITD